jgi:hypothetical protein
MLALSCHSSEGALSSGPASCVFLVAPQWQPQPPGAHPPPPPKEHPLGGSLDPFDFPAVLKTESCWVFRPLWHFGQAILCVFLRTTRS